MNHSRDETLEASTAENVIKRLEMIFLSAEIRDRTNFTNDLHLRCVESTESESDAYLIATVTSVIRQQNELDEALQVYSRDAQQICISLSTS